jgi:hypothetical protein
VRPPVARSPAAPAPEPARADRSAWAKTVRRLPGYQDAVLATAADGALPDLRRVRVIADEARRLLRLESADGEPLPASLPVARGSLLFHGHDDRLGALRQFGVLGAVTADHDGLALHPQRFVPGSTPESPLQMARTVLRLRRTAKDYLAERGLPRPAVDWDAFQQLKKAGAPRP